MNETKVIHITFKNLDTQRYFASLGALYSVYSRDDLGIAYQSLKNYWGKTNQPYENAICTIRKGILERNSKE